MQSFFPPLLVLLLALGCSACEDRSQPLPEKDLYSPQEMAQESARAQAFFEAYFERLVALSPERLSILNRDRLQDKWTRWTEAQWQAEQQIHQAALVFLKDSLQYNALVASTQLNFRLLEEQLEQQLAGADFRYHNFPLQPISGLQLYLPNFLQVHHSIEDVEDAEAYLQRLQDIPLKISDVLEQLKKRSEKGILPPPFVFEQVAADCRALLSGYPLDADTTKLHPLYQDFLTKIARLNLSDSIQNIYRFDAEQALHNQFGRAYRALLRYWERLAPLATEELSWQQFPAGAAAYAWQLREVSTTDLSAAAMHQVGLKEVSDLQEKISALMMQLGSQGSLQDFLQSLREREVLYQAKPPSDSSQQANRAAFEELLRAIPQQLSSSFEHYKLPTWNSDSLFARYEAARVPQHEMQAWLYYEAVHPLFFQGAWIKTLADLPKFRKYGKAYPAYLQGWQAYMVHLLQEKGAYEPTEALLGHLTRALWRASQLVVDTGIHGKGWTKQEALAYYLENTAASRAHCEAAIEKQAVLAGSSTAASIGLLHLHALRQKAEQQLLDDFNEARFHEIILQNGPVSLSILEDLIDDYIAEERGE